MEIERSDPFTTLGITSEGVRTCSDVKVKHTWKEGEELSIFMADSDGVFGVDPKFFESGRTVHDVIDPFNDSPDEGCKHTIPPYIADIEIEDAGGNDVEICVFRDKATGMLFGIDLSFIEHCYDYIRHPYIESKKPWFLGDD